MNKFSGDSVPNRTREPLLRPSFEFVSGTDIREPTTGREAMYRPTEATPLVYDEQHQAEVWSMMKNLIIYEFGENISKKTLEFIIHAIGNRMVARDGSNAASYTMRLNTAPYSTELPSGLACMHAEQGTGTMQENDVARRFFGMSSVEYGNLTIVGDKRLEYLPGMYNEADELLGGMRVQTAAYGTRIIAFDRNPVESNHLGSMRIQMKHRLGTLNDSTEVKQRTLAIIDLSPSSGFDQDIVRAIISAYRSGSTDIIRDANGLKRALDELERLELAHPLVLARNETIYGYNQETEAKIKQRNLRQSLARAGSKAVL